MERVFSVQSATETHRRRLILHGPSDEVIFSDILRAGIEMDGVLE